MRGASAGKTMYVVPYLMAPLGSPLEAYAAGVELTDHRTVVLHMIRMARVGVEYIDNLTDPNAFVRAVHVTGDLENLGQGTPDDQRYFVTLADERTILHFGSSYGGNALLGKIAHGLRQAAYDGWVSGEFLAEQFMLVGITDKQTGRTYHVCGGFPSASGKTNLAMMLAPDALGDRYHVEFYGDDIAWLRVDPEDGKIYAINPEFGVFGVAKDTNETPTRPRWRRSGPAPAPCSPTSPTTTSRRTCGGRARRPSRRPTSPAGATGPGSSSPNVPTPTRTRRGHTRTAGSPPRWPTCPTSPPTSRTRRGADRRDHLRRPHPRPRAADPRHHRPRRRRVRRPHPRRRGHLRRRRRRRPTALRPHVDAAVHVLPGRRLRRALAQDHRRGCRSSRSSRT